MIEYTDTAIVIPIADVQIPDVEDYAKLPKVSHYLATESSADEALITSAGNALWVRARAERIRHEQAVEDARRFEVLVDIVRVALGERARLMSSTALRDIAAGIDADKRIPTGRYDVKVPAPEGEAS